MTTYTLSLVSAEAIKDDIEFLVGHKHLWRVEREGKVVAYCIDKAFADRIVELSYATSASDGTGHLFPYPSAGSAVAMCVGAVNSLLP